MKNILKDKRLLIAGAGAAVIIVVLAVILIVNGVKKSGNKAVADNKAQKNESTTVNSDVNKTVKQTETATESEISTEENNSSEESSASEENNSSEENSASEENGSFQADSSNGGDGNSSGNYNGSADSNQNSYVKPSAASAKHLVYNDDGSFNLQESYWSTSFKSSGYVSTKELSNALSTVPEFMELVNKVNALGNPVSSWQGFTSDVKERATAKDIEYYIYLKDLSYCYVFTYDDNGFHFARQTALRTLQGGTGSSQPEADFEDNLVYNSDGTLNLNESYWRKDTSDDSIYGKIMQTNEFRSVDMSGYNRYGATIYGSYNSKNTAKDYLFTFYYPDGSEKYLRYNGEKFCIIYQWNG